MNKDPKISHIQLRGLIISTTIGVGVLSMQSSLAREMGSDGWIAILITGILMIPLLLIYNQIFKLYPGKDFFEIGRSTLGFLFYLVLLVLLCYLVLISSTVARNLGELIKTFLLQNTPVQIIILVFIIATSYIATHEIDTIARASYFIYPIIIIFAVFIVIISLPKADFTNILPVFQTDFTSLIKGVRESLFSFYGLEMVLFAIPFVEEKDKIFKSEAIGVFTVIAIYISLYIMTLSHFSIEQIQNRNYPVVFLVRQLDLPGFFLENLDGIVIALWVLVVFASMAPLYFGAGKILSKMFKTKSHKYFIWGLIPVIYYVSLIPKNYIELVTEMSKYLNIAALLAVFVLPLLMLIVGYIRKKVGK